MSTEKEMMETPEYVQAKELMPKIETAVNYMGRHDEATVLGLSHGLLSMHRTLQQNFTRILVGMIVYLGEYYEKYPERTDARNDSSAKFFVQTTKFIKEKAEKDDGFYFPHI